GRRFTGVEWPPREVRFVHEAPADASHLRAFFRCPLRFGAEHTEVVLPAGDLARPLVKADRRLSALLARFPERALERHAASAAANDRRGLGRAPMTHRVRSLLATRLADGISTIDAVAGAL